MLMTIILLMCIAVASEAARSANPPVRESSLRNANSGEFKQTPCTAPKRREIRTLSFEEKKKFYKGLEAFALKSRLQNYTVIHEVDFPMSHTDPTFYPWHRELLNRVEIEVREITGDADWVAHYWDPSLNAGDIQTLKGVLEKDFLGTKSRFILRNALGTDKTKGDHRVGDGLFHKFYYNDSFYLARPFRKKEPFSSFNKTFTMELLSYEYRFFNDILRERHKAAHDFVGGTFGEHFSTMDPLFVLLHSFVDLMYRLRSHEHGEKYKPDAYLIHFEKKTVNGVLYNNNHCVDYELADWFKEELLKQPPNIQKMVETNLKAGLMLNINEALNPVYVSPNLRAIPDIAVPAGLPENATAVDEPEKEEEGEEGEGEEGSTEEIREENRLEALKMKCLADKAKKADLNPECASRFSIKSNAEAFAKAPLAAFFIVFLFTYLL